MECLIESLLCVAGHEGDGEAEACGDDHEQPTVPGGAGEDHRSSDEGRQRAGRTASADLRHDGHSGWSPAVR